MKFLIVREEADGGFEPITIVDDPLTGIEEIGRLKRKHPQSNYTILKQV